MPSVANIGCHAGLTEISPNNEICSTVVCRHPLVAPSANALSRFRESIDGPFDRGTAHKQLYSAVKLRKTFRKIDNELIMSFTLFHQRFNEYYALDIRQ